MSDVTPSDARPPRDSMPREVSADHDLLLRQVRAVLTPMPEVNRRAVASIMAAVAERRGTPWQRVVARWEYAVEWWRFSTSPLARGASLAAAALTIGFVARGYMMRDGSLPADASRVAAASAVAAERAAPAPAPAPTPATLRAVDATDDPSAFRIPTQFMIDARDVPVGARVSLVGDFNDWNVTALPMTLERGVWVATVPLSPGRHVYAFVANGERWIADPRAPRAPDADFGRPGSVIIVQAP
ncbi:MAG: isoamylase early set domain-containing protein [Gemmatimonas sp.]|uniref:isoamylase early set domain-containing protein n=1 Tax=Gemmatimonas sp. TaxID=1962908 RepID=UPI00391F0AD9